MMWTVGGRPRLLLPPDSTTLPGSLYAPFEFKASCLRYSRKEALYVMGTCYSVPAPSDSRIDDLAYENERSNTAVLAFHDVQAQLPFDGKDFHATYQLGPLIGEGAVSMVYLATVKAAGPHKDMQVVVKCIDRDFLPREDKEDILEEVRILRNLNHPNIIKIYQFFEDDPRKYYIVTEFMEGGELFDRIVEKEIYNEKEARDLCRILLDAVKYIHDLGIVHRSLNLENLLLTSKQDDANVKLADFGFARSVLNGFISTQCGNTGYVAPEILRREAHGTSVDMWSIGVIIYILLGGYPPFHDVNQSRLFRKIKMGNFKFHEEYWLSVSNDAKDLIKKLLTVNPEKRWTAAQAIRHPWLFSKEDDLVSHDLSASLQQLKLLNARCKLRAAVKSVIATQRLAKTFGVEVWN